MLRLRDSRTGRDIYLCQHADCLSVQHRTERAARDHFERLDKRGASHECRCHYGPHKEGEE